MLRFLIIIATSRFLWQFFKRLGVFGLFLLSILDSSFLVLPFGNDILLIGLISSQQHHWIWIGYVLSAAIGSVLGVLLIDLPMRRAGEKGLQRFVSSRRVEKLKKSMEEKAGITLFLATLLPPPFPFTPVFMTASALQYPREKLLGMVFAGRSLRYTVEAILALYLGRKLIRYINSDIFEYFVYGLIALAVVASFFSVLRWLRKHDGKRSAGLFGLWRTRAGHGR